MRSGGRFAELTGADVKAPNVTVGHVESQPSAERLTQFASWIDAGSIRVVIDETFPLERVQDAQRKVEMRHTRGKIVLTIP